jgi:predicted nucleotidyltransferase
MSVNINALIDKKDAILALAAANGAEDLRIFGSAAKGEAGPESDLDVLIRLETGRSLLDIVALKQDLEDLLGCEVHVVTEKSISPYMREAVLKEAIML